MEITFSEQVKETIANSRLECLKLGYNVISEEMLVLGMIRRADKDNELFMNGAVSTLLSISIDLDRLARFLVSNISSRLKKVKELPTGNIRLTKRAEQVLKFSYQMTIPFGEHGSIDTIHLLASFLKNLTANEAKRCQGETGLDLRRISVQVTYDDFISKKLMKEVVSDQILYYEEHLKRFSDLSIKRHNTIENPPKAPPLSLIFDMDEYSSEEVKEIIALIGDLYHHQSGDHLVIKGMSQFQIVQHLECI